MKILFLTNLPSPYRVDFFNELGKECELTVLYERRTASNRDKNWVGNSACNFKEIYLKGINIGEESSVSFEIIKYLKDETYTHIVISGYGTHTSKIAIMWLFLHKLKFIMNVDGGIIKENSGLKYYIKKFFISKATLYLAASRSTVEYLVHYGAKREKCYVYPFTSLLKKDIIKHPYSTEQKIALRKKLGIKEKKVVISVGQFIYRKGFDNLLRAAVDIKGDVGIYIVGGIPTREYLNILKENAINNVHFVEFMDKEELSKYYLASDLFVLPTREDIWGLVINEAMAKGLPVITTNMCVAGTELIKEGENGYIVEKENIEMLSQKVNMVLENETNVFEMSKKSLDIIEYYSIENMAKVSLAIIKKM